MPSAWSPSIKSDAEIFVVLKIGKIAQRGASYPLMIKQGGAGTLLETASVISSKVLIKYKWMLKLFWPIRVWGVFIQNRTGSWVSPSLNLPPLTCSVKYKKILRIRRLYLSLSHFPSLSLSPLLISLSLSLNPPFLSLSIHLFLSLCLGI